MNDSLGALPRRTQIWARIVAINARFSQLEGILGTQIGVTAPQWALLSLLETMSDGHGASVKDLALLMSVDSSYVSALAKLLLREKMIRRDPSPTDRRLALLSLTDMGRERMAPAWRNYVRLMTYVRNKKNEEQLEELKDVLDMMQTRLKKAILFASAGE
ncbi:MAG: transcriptional regulator, MarR family [Tardiphaga sp.]|jgi:DNA-binding MarR family transcriptional regulator|nr:transcriptional regulator, MarR family [Tardiphaga sp.]